MNSLDVKRQKTQNTINVIYVEKERSSIVIPWFFFVIVIIVGIVIVLTCIHPMEESLTEPEEPSQEASMVADFTMAMADDTHFEAVPEQSDIPEEISPTSLLVVDENGFVFAESSNRYLTEADLEILKTSFDSNTYNEILQMGINEIYARKGYCFEKEEIFMFYIQYPWYCGSASMDEARASFNEFECYNADFLCNRMDD